MLLAEVKPLSLITVEASHIVRVSLGNMTSCITIAN